MNKLLKKLIAVLLLMCLVSANLSTLGFYGITYALSESEIANQNSKTQDSNVEFNAYFEGGVHEKTEKMDSTAKLYLDIKVNGTGYLEKGVISFQNTNFEIDKSISDSNIQSVDIKNNKILLNKISGGSNVKIEVPVNILKADEVPVDNFSKETKTVFTATYINNNAKEKNVSKEIINKLSWDAIVDETILTDVKAELTKYITFKSTEKSVVVLQAKINSAIKDNKLPIKETQLDIQVPEINNIKPTTVNVVASQTKATNGETTGLNFGKDNYSYDAETGKLTIDVKNSSNKMYWVKNVSDEYLATFIFESNEVYNYLIENEVNADLKINGNITVYSNQEKAIKIQEVNAKLNATEAKGDLVDYSINADSSIAKGQIYANYNAKNKKETTYNISYSAMVNSVDLTESLKFEQKFDQFATEEDSQSATTVAGNNYAYNKTIKVAKNVFEKILGEEGYIDIFDSENNKIGTINKESTLENEVYVLDISEANNNKMTMVTSKPISEGQLTIDLEKAIKENIDYTKQQVQKFKKLVVQLNNTVKEISLTEPKTVIDVEISKPDLTTVVENENVEIRAILDTSDINNALYNNTALKIKLPPYISRFKLNSYDILMSNGLKIKSVKPVNENGQAVVYVELEGEQTEYTIDAKYKGTIIVLNTNITVKPLTPNSESKLTMEYSNSNTIAKNAKGTVETNINFTAPQGIVTANGVSDYAKGKEDIFVISDEKATGTISAYSEKTTATINQKIVNNYSNKIKNIVILGKLPVKGNKTIDTNQDLSSTFSTTLNGNVTLNEIDSSLYTVYYSTNANATKDLNSQENGWSTEPTNNAQAYLIVLNNYELEAGKSLEVTYKVEIPANLTYNNTTSQMYKIYYTNSSSIGELSESKESPIVKLTTGEGPSLSIELKPTVETIREGQIVKMKAVIKNTGSLAATDAKARIPLPEYTKFINYISGTAFEVDDAKTKNINIGTIEPGESKEISYYIKTSKVSDLSIVEGGENVPTYPKTITNKLYVSVSGVEGEVPSNECVMNLQEGKISLNMVGDVGENYVIKNGTNIRYHINLTNISKKGDLQNTVVTIPLAKGFKYKSAVIKESWSAKEETTDGISYDQNSNTVTANLGTLSISKLIELNVEVEKFEGNISVIAKAKADGAEECFSNISEYEAEIVKLTISDLTSTPRYVKENEEITYKFTITNGGKTTANNIVIEDVLPEGLKLKKTIYKYAGKEQTVNSNDGQKVKISILVLKSGDTAEITLIAKANLLADKEDKTVTNKMSITANGFDKVETNSVTNTIEYDEDAHKPGQPTDPSNPTNPTDPSNPNKKTYKITGTAWIDSNKNGMRDEDEEFLQNINVYLFYKNTSQIVKDSSTNTEKITKTNDKGKYEFTNLLPGEYFVIFDYGNGKYSLTEYRKPGVNEDVNSDAIDFNITLNGIKTIVGLSDGIKISDSNVRDIDIGVYVAEKFDLKLDKYITKITRTTPTSGTEVFSYNNEKNTKIEVLKQNLGKSSVVIEYKIVVTNEGGVAGYAKKLVDYLPKGVVFNTELNKDWYLAKDGNVYNTSLENTLIKPGESKEVTLVLLKQITSDSIGILNNNAEIYESYNEQGLSDIDSVAGNKKEDEDDMSKADIVLGIVTGAKIAGYTVLALSVVAIIVFGIIEIKKRVLTKK